MRNRPSEIRRRVRIMAGILAAVLAAPAASGPLWAGGAAAQGEEPAPSRQPLSVRVIRAEPRPIERVFALTGEVAPRETVDVAFPMGGRILSVAHEEGDRVRRGEELARLDAIQQEQALRAAEAALDAAVAEFRRAEAEARRQEALLERGATTRVRRDEARRAFFVARANRERAKAELDRARKALDDTVLRAPADGQVIARHAEPGEVIGAARAVLTLAIGDELDAVFAAPETAPTGVPEALDITLVPISAPDREYVGRIRRVSPLVDPRTGTVEVTVGIVPPYGALGFGDPVRAIVRQTTAPRIVLPSTALSALGDAPAVWTVDEASGRVSIVPVRIDAYADGMMIVDDGLAPGALVVARGVQLLYPGRKVTPVLEQEGPEVLQ
ncbi:MAG: efflux RND transporter periplasmic adaptor subunit [Alphaproteobacteria bacterium]|nr:MAG: efflux RND transporter periplasmic adaptor subunit [Alphaproteobacteria bacterium]